MLRTKRPVVLALLAAGLLAAGCGGDDGEDDDVASLSEGDSDDESSEGDDTEADLAEWAQCMRDEGVDMPDPTRDEDGNMVIEGPGISIGGGGATFESNSEDEGPPFTPEDMEAAETACGLPPAAGGEFSEEDRTDMEADALEFAECMRDEGIDDFPDPDFSDEGPGGAPETNTSSGEPDEGGGDGSQARIALGPFGEIDMDDPATASAFEACQDLMGIPGGPGGPGGPGPESDGSDA